MLAVRTLVLDCSTEACSVAYFEGPDLLAHRFEVIGRGHAERLVPMISELPDKGRAERILVSLGPGSFTGVRIGLAAARALGLAWGAQVLGYPGHALVVETGLAGRDAPIEPEVMSPDRVLACMNGGHGEWFVQPFDADHTPSASCRSMIPQDAAQVFSEPIVIGNRAAQFVDMRESGVAIDTLPDARDAILIASDLLRTDLTPIYGRGPDARLPETAQ